MQEKIVYESNLDGDEYPMLFITEAEGIGLLWIRSNRRNRGEAVGNFIKQLDQRDNQMLFNLVKQEVFVQSPSQESLIPDETYRQITYSKGGKQLVKIVGETLQSPAAFVQVEQVVHAMTKTLQHSPVFSLRMQMKAPQRIQSGDMAEFIVRVLAQGAQVAKFDNPQLWGEGGTMVTLSGLRADIPLAELRTKHQAFINLTSESVSAINPRQESPAITVHSGRYIDVTYQLMLEWEPGLYNVELTIATLLSTEGSEVSSMVELMSPTVQLEVMPAP